MPGQFSVDTALMAQAAGSVEQAAGDIATYLGRLDGELDQMFAAWQGDGADAHRRAHERFATDASAVNAALAKLQQALSRTQQVYGTQESQQNSDGQSIARQINS